MTMLCTAQTGALILCLALCGCNRYAFSINDRELYHPPPLYNQFDVVDQALADCIAQSIVDQRITSAEQLKSLRCSHAGIRSLAGIEHFSQLEKVDFSHNELRNLEPLTRLEKLILVKLEGNRDVRCADITAGDQSTRPSISCSDTSSS